MLSIEKDFYWTCTAMDYPLYAFEFRSKIREETENTGEPLIKINILVNINSCRFSASTCILHDNYYRHCPKIEEFYEYIIQQLIPHS